MPAPTGISVVVPAYNAALTIAVTLNSILAQRFAPIDIVVVDDGSKDATREVLTPFANHACIVHQANAGVSAARNRGMAEAQADWVAFCDADDVWHEDKLAIVAAAIERAEDADLVFHDFWSIESGLVVDARSTHSANSMFPIFKELDVTMRQILPERRVVATASAEFPLVDTWFGAPLRWLMLGNFLMPSTVVVRKSAFLAAGAFDRDFRYAEDTEFFLRFAKHSSFLWVDAPLTGYRRAPGTLLTGNMMPTMKGALRAVVKHCVEDESVMRSDPAWVRKAVARRYLRLAYFCLSELERRDARTYALDALRYDPLNARAFGVLSAALVPAPALRLARQAKRVLNAW